MITSLVRRVVPLIGLGVVLGSIIRSQHVPLVSADAWFHLRFGREFLSDWSLAHPGHLGVYDTAQWVPTQWLPQIGMAWIEDHFGITGLMWVTGALLLLLAILVYVSCRVLASPLPAAITTALALMAASPGLSARPQLFSSLLIVVTTSAWLATARDGKPRYWLIALAWVWPMLHGMWPVGISISVAAVVALALQRELPGRALVRLAVIPLGSCVVAALTPLGLSVVHGLFDVESRSQYFAEWGPTDFTEPAAAVLAVMIAIVFLAGLRGGPLPWVHVAMALLALGWGLYSVRTTPVAALMLAPLLGAALQSLVPVTGPMTRVERVVVATMLVVGCVVMGAVASQRHSEQVVPQWVDGRLDALPAGSRVLNDWPAGSYLLFRHPDLDLVMHGYGDVFTDEELSRNADVLRLEPGWDDLVAQLDADAALVDPGSALGYALKAQLGWSQVEGDEDFVLLTPPGQP